MLHRIAQYPRIPRQKNQIVLDGLGYQYPIKRVSVQQRQFSQINHCRLIDREALDLMQNALSRQIFFCGRWQLELPKS